MLVTKLSKTATLFLPFEYFIAPSISPSGRNEPELSMRDRSRKRNRHWLGIDRVTPANRARNTAIVVKSGKNTFNAVTSNVYFPYYFLSDILRVEFFHKDGEAYRSPSLSKLAERKALGQKRKESATKRRWTMYENNRRYAVRPGETSEFQRKRAC